jgi:hypothetical protein
VRILVVRYVESMRTICRSDLPFFQLLTAKDKSTNGKCCLKLMPDLADRYEMQAQATYMQKILGLAQHFVCKSSLQNGASDSMLPTPVTA